MVYLIGGIKASETGKTTIALHFAIWLHKQGHNVLLIETDDKGPSMSFSETRKKALNSNIDYHINKLTSEKLGNSLPVLKKMYDYVVIDIDSNHNLIEADAHLHSDIILTPFLPWAYSMGLINRLRETIRAIKMKNQNVRVYTFINMSNQPGDSGYDIKRLLSTVDEVTALNCSLSKSNAFKDAAIKGLSVTELTEPDQRASHELNSLFTEIQTRQKENLKVRVPIKDKNEIAIVKDSKDISLKSIASQGTDKNEYLLKHINVMMQQNEIDQIYELRKQRPKKSRSQKKSLGITLQDWIGEAILEKIKRDSKTGIGTAKATRMNPLKPNASLITNNDEIIWKRINVKIYQNEIEQIYELRKHRPKRSRSQKKGLGITLQDWIIEAIQEKIKFEKRISK